MKIGIDNLVSIVISTFNSSKYIEETIENTKAQTWKNLELVITDDCSTDNTVELCRHWIEKNRNRFVRAEVLTYEINTGISANANRGLNAAKGEWIKFLGADDTLKANCISDNMEFISGNPDIKVLFSQVEVYKNTFVQDNYLKTIPGVISERGNIFSPKITAESQYKMLLLSDRIHFSPSLFIHRDTLLSVGGFDERFPMLEDYPLWLNLTKAGHRLCFMDKVTVNYRQHLNAINNTGRDYIINPNYFKEETFRKIYTYPNLPGAIRLSSRYCWYASLLYHCTWINKNSMLNRVIVAILTIYLNPFKYYIYVQKLLNKNLRNDVFYM